MSLKRTIGALATSLVLLYSACSTQKQVQPDIIPQVKPTIQSVKSDTLQQVTNSPKSPKKDLDAVIVGYTAPINPITRCIQSITPLIDYNDHTDTTGIDYTLVLNNTELPSNANEKDISKLCSPGLNVLKIELNDKNLNGNYAFVYFQLDKNGKADIPVVSSSKPQLEGVLSVLDEKADQRYTEAQNDIQKLLILLDEETATVETKKMELTTISDKIEKQKETHESFMKYLDQRYTTILNNLALLGNTKKDSLTTLKTQLKDRLDLISYLQRQLAEKSDTIYTTRDTTIYVTIDSVVIDHDTTKLDFHYAWGGFEKSPRVSSCKTEYNEEKKEATIDVTFTDPDSDNPMKLLALFQESKLIAYVAGQKNATFHIPETYLKDNPEYRVIAVDTDGHANATRSLFPARKRK